MTRLAAPRIAILASGEGSNFEAIAQAIATGRLYAEIVCVISDRAEAPVLERAKKRGIKAYFIAPQKPREAHDQAILEKLNAFPPDERPTYLVLAGYMRVLSTVLLQAYRSPRGYSRVVNIHPSILPSFPGVKSYEQAWNYGCKVAGITVHLVESAVDSGPICAQRAFTIEDCVDLDEVKRRGLAIEHHLFPETLAWVLKDEFEFETRDGQRRFCVRPH